MLTRLNECGFTLIEFFLSIVALFLLLLISYPIVQELIEQKHTSQIKNNLIQIRNFADIYFEEHSTNSVSLYEFIGPRKVIPKFEAVADEVYPKIILRDNEISAYSKKYGTISVQ